MTVVGINAFRFDQAIGDDLARIQPGIIVTGGDIGAPAWNLMAAHAQAGALVVYRQMTPGNYDNHGVDPADLAAAALASVAGVRHLFPAGALALAGYNECITSGNVVEQAPRELAFVRAVQAEGLPVVALNAAVGNLEPEHIPLLIDLWREAAAIGYHGYCRPGATDMDSIVWPWHLRRPERLWLPVLQGHGLDLSKLILMETGTFFPPFPGMVPEGYATLLCDIQEYASQTGMLGTAGFTLSAYPPFGQGGDQPFEFCGTGAVDVLAAYNEGHRAAPIRLTIPGQGQIHVYNPGGSSLQSGSEGDDGMAAAKFVLGFADVAARLGAAVVGEPQADERSLHDADGSVVLAIQPTTTGYMIYVPGGAPGFVKALR